MQYINPAKVHSPMGSYSHACLVPSGSELLYIAGQVGVDPKGTLLVGIEAQARQVFRNLLACLEEHGMDYSHLAKTTVYLTDEDHIPAMRSAREEAFGTIMPPSTLLIVKALARPGMLMEVEGVAWRRDNDT